MKIKGIILLIFAIAFSLSGCNLLLYQVMPKREVLKSAIEEATNTQEDAKEQFEDALDKYREVVSFDGGELETAYKTLNSEYKQSKEQVKKLSARIDNVENVAKDLFAEWEQEISLYTNPTLKAESSRQLSDTKQRAQNLIREMRRVESQMDPVLNAFGDQVLLLKHSLNAAAIAALQGELQAIEASVNSLIEELEASIAYSNDFLESLQQDS